MQLNKLINPQSKPVTVQRALLYLTIPYHGKHSYHFRNRLCKLLREFYPQVNLRVIFKINNTLGRYFKFKDRIPDALQSNLIYHYQCDRCTATYLGQTKRQFKIRIAEHQGRSFRTNNLLAKPSFSAVRLHSESCDHPIHSKNFSVLKICSDDMSRHICESLLTSRMKPSLGTHESSTELLCF